MENKSAELKELFTALSKAQAEMDIAGLSSTNPFFKSKYADFATIVRASRPALTKNGLSVVQQISTHGDQLLLHTVLCHNSGQWMESCMLIKPSKPDIQSLGSHITYIKRYCYAALVGVLTGDDDGEEAMADYRETPKKAEIKKEEPKVIVSSISQDQADVLESESEDLKYVEAIWKHYNISKWEMLPQAAYEVVKLKLRNHNKTLEELKGE